MQDALAALGHPLNLPDIVPLPRVPLDHAVQTLAARLRLEEHALWQVHGRAEALRARMSDALLIMPGAELAVNAELTPPDLKALPDVLDEESSE